MNRILDHDDLFPAWVSNLLLFQPSIRNEPIEPFLGSGMIQLENYDLVCVGYRDNKKYLVGLRILKQLESIPLKGAHEVMLTHTSVGLKTIEVVSLTHLKRHILQFHDSLSFERSTFLILHEHQKVIRLKYIRGRISLPSSNQLLTQPTLTQRTRLQTQILSETSILLFSGNYTDVKKKSLRNNSRKKWSLQSALLCKNNEVCTCP